MIEPREAISVLMIEDNDVDAMLIRRLAGTGFDIQHARTAQDALEALAAFDPQVILLDYTLPDATGFELLSHLDTERTPVVMLTGQEDVRVAVDALRAGARDYLLKTDLTADLLRRAVRAAVADQERREALRWHATLAAASPDAIVQISRDGVQLRASGHDGPIPGLRKYYIGKTLADCFPEAAVTQLSAALSACFEDDGVHTSRVRLDLVGQAVILEFRFKALDSRSAISVVRDATRETNLRLKLAEAASRDALTGLYSRQFTLHRLDAELRRATRYAHDVSVVMMDIDHFKRVNDTYGHAGGDQVLMAVGSVIKRTIRQSVDSAGRFGGEEFLIILPETGGSRRRGTG